MIDHTILLKRLSNQMGINVMALKWFQSYLSDIYRYVNFEGLSSKSVPLNHGVTQGSALGWVLINIYITPLANIIRELGIEFHVYINDYQLYLEFQPTSGPYEWFFKWGADRRPANWISGGWKGACGISGKVGGQAEWFLKWGDWGPLKIIVRWNGYHQ